MNDCLLRYDCTAVSLTPHDSYPYSLEPYWRKLGIARRPATRIWSLRFSEFNTLEQFGIYAKLQRSVRKSIVSMETLSFVSLVYLCDLYNFAKFAVSFSPPPSPLDLSLQLRLHMPAYYHRSANLEQSSSARSCSPISRQMAFLSRLGHTRAILGALLFSQLPRPSRRLIKNI